VFKILDSLSNSLRVCLQAGVESDLLALVLPMTVKHAKLLISPTERNIDQTILEGTKSLIESAAVPAGILDADLKFVTCSDAWINWYNQYYGSEIQNQSQIVGKSFYKFVHHCPNIIKENFATNLLGQFTHCNSLSIPSKPVKRVVQWESTGFSNIEGKMLGILFSHRDITNEHNLEMKNKQLFQANEMLQNFALIFAHDVMQPIFQLSCFVDLLKAHLEKMQLQDDTVNYYVDTIKRSLKHIYNLGDGISIYAQKESIETCREEVSLRQVIQQIQESCLIERKALLQIEIEGDVILYANHTGIIQLFQNLLTNAVKYSIGDKPVIILKGRKLKSGYFKFILTNNGYSPIFLPSLVEKIKEENTDNNWVGLGLMICNKVVSSYKGKISFRSSKKSGKTVVKFTLPLHELKAV